MLSLQHINHSNLIVCDNILVTASLIAIVLCYCLPIALPLSDKNTHAYKQIHISVSKHATPFKWNAVRASKPKHKRQLL